jgi:hypothetical protein
LLLSIKQNKKREESVREKEREERERKRENDKI